MELNTNQTAPGATLLLNAVRRTCQRLWNATQISADEKRAAKAYFDTNGDDAHKLYALNKRMAALITTRTAAHQRNPA